MEYSLVADHWQYAAMIVASGIRRRRGGNPRPPSLEPVARRGVVPGIIGKPGRIDLATELDVRQHRNALSDNDPTKSRMLDGPRQPGHRFGTLGADRRGDRAVRSGPGNQARLCPGAHRPRRRIGGVRADRRGDRTVPSALETKSDDAEAHNNLGFALAARPERRGDRAVSEGTGNQARLRRGPLQPGLRLGGRDGPTRRSCITIGP